MCWARRARRINKKSGHQSVVAQDKSVGVLKLDGPRRTGLFADIMVS